MIEHCMIDHWSIMIWSCLSLLAIGLRVIEVGLGWVWRSGVWVESGRPDCKPGLPEHTQTITQTKFQFFFLPSHKILLIFSQCKRTSGEPQKLYHLKASLRVINFQPLDFEYPFLKCSQILILQKSSSSSDIPIHSVAQVATRHDQHTSAMDVLEDVISELSSLSSYPNFPGNISQNLPKPENTSDIPDIDSGCDRSQVSLLWSVSLVSTVTFQPKRQQLTPRSWLWATVEELLELSVEVRGIK